MNKDQIIAALIGNAASGFTEADRNYLQGLDVKRLEQFQTNATKAAAPAVAAVAPAAAPAVVAPAANAEPVKPAAPALNAEDQAALNYGKRQLATNKAALVAKITGYPLNKFSAETLNTKSIDELEAIAAMVPDAPGAAVLPDRAPAANSQGKGPGAVLEVPVINFEAPAKAKA